MLGRAVCRHEPNVAAGGRGATASAIGAKDNLTALTLVTPDLSHSELPSHATLA
jgi:hypothetical protein